MFYYANRRHAAEAGAEVEAVGDSHCHAPAARSGDVGPTPPPPDRLQRGRFHRVAHETVVDVHQRVTAADDERRLVWSRVGWSENLRIRVPGNEAMVSLYL